ncbi:hypothetical protein P5673_006276 [Acropora cervicornis]|uniref:Uncharacterized protein n=1 Tax=Acropora cervicornis TaxID=6130 RepID=A0AAD9QXR5_ACRCE|nr:hypothetical protein P5673_006276 [Acropora cervicornis]
MAASFQRGFFQDETKMSSCSQIVFVPNELFADLNAGGGYLLPSLQTPENRMGDDLEGPPAVENLPQSINSLSLPTKGANNRIIVIALPPAS